jgi:drug/metabolite transporter (DMT)-like permease
VQHSLFSHCENDVALGETVMNAFGHDPRLEKSRRPMSPGTHRLFAHGCLALSMSLVGGYEWLGQRNAFLGNFLFSVCMLFGVSMTSAVSAGVIMASIPAVVAVMSWAFLRERIGIRVWGAVACAGMGIALLGLAKPEGQASTAATSWLGNLLVFGAVLCEAAYAVIGKKLTGALGPKRITSLINLWGFALVTPFGLYMAWRFDFGSVQPGIWLLLVFYSLAASVWTVWLWMTGLKMVPAAQGGVFAVMLPVSAALVGVFALGERLASIQLLAFVLALAGVVLATLPVKAAARS